MNKVQFFLLTATVVSGLLIGSCCDDEELFYCELDCSDSREACIVDCRVARDACKAVCVENFPEYMDCYWYCRTEHRHQLSSTENCLDGCADTFDPTGEALICVGDCDLAYENSEIECEDREELCQDECYDW